MIVSGLSAFPITPADPDGRVDVPALRRLVAPLVAARVDSIGLLGSTGTYMYLSRAERRRALDAALDEAGGLVPVLVGIGALRTDEAVRLAADAKAAGAAAGLLAPVSYTPLGDDEVYAHVETVALKSGLPICLYDNPATTHFRFTPALVGRLARVPGIVALKSPAPDPAEVPAHLAALRGAVPDGFSVGVSVDWHAAEALLAGADAWYSVAAGPFPRTCLALVGAARGGDAAEARRLDGCLRPLWAFFREYSSLRVVHAIAALRGVAAAEPPRPILPLSAEARERVAHLLARPDFADLC